MPRARSNGIEIEYDTFGSEQGRPLLLIMGLASQLIAWPERFCRKLAGRGHFVIRFDNRDVGLSTKLEKVGVPDIMKAFEKAMQGKVVSAPYHLSDMAADAVGLLDALSLNRAHVCGLSMGGMIAQTMAIECPQRLISLISMESSTGEPELPTGTPQAMEAMMSIPPTERQAQIEYSIDVYRAFAGGSDKYDAALQGEISAMAFDRSFYPQGFTRQMAAILASGGRRRALQSIDAPTLVIHGSNDSLVPLEHARDTANAVPGAKLVVIEGLGHGMAYPELWDQMVDAITEHTISAESKK